MRISRRTFLKLSGGLLVGATGLATLQVDPPEWLPGVRLGRMTESRIRLYNRPHPDGSEVGFRYRDDVVTVLREVVGLGFYPHNHVWFETPAGYAYSAWVQPVRFAPMEPLAEVLSPLSPNIDGKLVSVSFSRQVLTAFEGAREVFRTTIASGRDYFAANGAAAGSLTPAGEQPLWQKRIARHTLAPRWRAAQVQA